MHACVNMEGKQAIRSAIACMWFRRKQRLTEYPNGQQIRFKPLSKQLPDTIEETN